MPLHAQIICIGGNGLVAVLFVLAAFAGVEEGSTGMSIFMLLLAGACLYTIWVLLKFRKYLGEEARQERDLRLERLRDELDPSGPGDPPDGSLH